MARLIALDRVQQFAAINLTADPGYDPSDHRIPNCADIVLTWVQEDGVIARNVLHGSYTGGYSGSQAQANAILSGLGTGATWNALAAFLPTTTSLAFVSLRDRNAEDQPITSSNGAAHPGTSVSPSLPNEVAAVLTLRTAFTGPAHRGRIYVPGLATNALGAGNVIAAAAVTALANWGSIIAGVLQGQGYLFCIGHTHRLAYTGINGAQHPERPAGTVPVQAVVMRDNHWDTQRRRGLK
jgi:hypothetical protein